MRSLRRPAMQDSELFQFASDVGSEQLEEICVMEALLERLAPALVPAAPAPDFQPRMEIP